MTEREGFLVAIAEDPLDMDTRKVFADFLDEHDEPELANFHRSMTVEKYETARKYLEDFTIAAHEGEGELADAFQEVINAGHKYLASGETSVVGSLFGFGASEQLVGAKAVQEFWDMWSIYTSTLLPDYVDDPFVCGC